MGHWYDSEGNPRHFEGPNGSPTTLRQARKLNLFPSVTTVGQVKYKFGLEQWKIETAVRYALTQGGDRDVKEVAREAFEELDRQAQDGTDIHDILEKYQQDVFNRVDDLKHGDMCFAVRNVIEENTGLDLHKDLKSETRFCDTALGYAGMCDLHNEHWIIDYKTKDVVDEKTKGWAEQAEQLAAYAHGLGYPNARLANIFISRTDPTQVVWYEHKDPLAWQRFRHALMMWQVENKYGPYFDSLEAAQ